ncbi:MAG: NifB/NifX family molybdenum-iron cluster-binding protein [Eubacteriales bacterium]
MKIAISTNIDNVDGIIDERFSMSKFLLIMEIDDDTLRMSSKSSYPFDMPETALAVVVIEENCEALISGILNYEAFNILANEGVTRFDGRGLTAKEAINRMNSQNLGYFKNPENEEDDIHIHQGSCEGHKH